MNEQEARTLQLHEMVVWTPDGMNGEVILQDRSGVKIRWEDGQFGYYQFYRPAVSNREVTLSEAPKEANPRRRAEAGSGERNRGFCEEPEMSILVS